MVAASVPDSGVKSSVSEMFELYSYIVCRLIRSSQLFSIGSPVSVGRTVSVGVGVTLGSLVIDGPADDTAGSGSPVEVQPARPIPTASTATVDRTRARVAMRSIVARQLAASLNDRRR